MIPGVDFLREDAARTERWKHLTKGLEEDKTGGVPGYQQKVVETLLDNMDLLLKGRLPQAKLAEETTTAGVAAFNKLAKPLIRRVFPNLVANRLVSIQPMSLPNMLIFYVDYKYATDLAPTAKGDRLDYQGGKRNKFYTSGQVRGESIGTGDGAGKVFNTDWYPVKHGSLVVYVDSVKTTAYTVDEDTGAITFTSAPDADAEITADYALVMEGLGAAGNAKIPEIELGMSSTSVTVDTYKVKSRWTIEGDQDFMAYHGESMESNIVPLMGNEIQLNLDRLIIDDLLAGATAGNVNWDSTVPSGMLERDHAETLVHAISEASTLIFKKRLRHANFIVMSPDNATYLDKINRYRALGWGGDGNPGYGTNSGATPTITIASGPHVFGTLSNRWTVIVDPLFANDKILVGYKGDNWLETGYVFAPYAAFTTQTFIDPNTMIPVKGLMTRAAKYLVSGDFYATVTVTASESES